MNRKGESEFELSGKSLYWMILVIILGFLIPAFIYVITSQVAATQSMPLKVRAEPIILRFLNSPECFAYQDPQGTVHPGIIDLQKFSTRSADLSRCYLVDESIKGTKQLNFGLQLKSKLSQDSSKGLSQESQNILRTDFYEYAPDYILEKPVWTFDPSQGGKFQPDVLLIGVQE
jgi:hypothetical protein